MVRPTTMVRLPTQRPALFMAAMARVPITRKHRVAPSASSSSSGGGNSSSEQQGSGSSPQDATREAVLAKLAAAKRYKEAHGGTFRMPGGASAPSSDGKVGNAIPAPQASLESIMASQKEPSDIVANFLASNEKTRTSEEGGLLAALDDVSKQDPGAADAQTQLYRERSRKANVKPLEAGSRLYSQQSQSSPQQSTTSTSGSSTQAAEFLSATLKQQQDRKDGIISTIQAGERLEEYLLKKEQKRSQDVEFITVDKSYKPKVSTWGMFPRPKNISETYGGGRTIKPGEALESAEDKKAREERVRERVLQYKIARGLIIDEATEAKCSDLYNQGIELMKGGRLAEAANCFEEIQGLVVLKSSWGGRACLQRAVCLDSLSQTKEAQILYRQITNHPEAEVAKKAKRMMFGIDSMTFLKADKISYNVNREDYEMYFRRIQSDWNTVYSESSEDDGSIIWQTALAAAVMVSPVLTVAGMILIK